MTQEKVHLAVYDTLADWEPGLAIAHINAPDFQKQPGRYAVKTVGRSRDPVTTKGGLRIVPDLVLADLDPSDSALLILPGADTAMKGDLDDFARKGVEFLASGTPVAAICGATAALARVGELDKREHTSNAREFLAMTKYAGGDFYRDKPAVSAGGLVTAGAVYSVEFAMEIFRLLDLYPENILKSWIKLFRDKDQAGFFEMMETAGQKA